MVRVNTATEWLEQGPGVGGAGSAPGAAGGRQDAATLRRDGASTPDGFCALGSGGPDQPATIQPGRSDRPAAPESNALAARLYTLRHGDRDVRLLDMPDVRQATSYTCGAASLQAVLAYYGRSFDGESDIAQALGTDPEHGVDPDSIARVAEAHGLRAEIREALTPEDLARYVAEGVPVIVSYQAWQDPPGATPWRDAWEDGHYSVVIGVDDRNVYLEDPSITWGVGYVPVAEFLERWHDYDKTGRRFHQLGIVLRDPRGLRQPKKILRVK